MPKQTKIKTPDHNFMIVKNAAQAQDVVSYDLWRCVSDGDIFIGIIHPLYGKFEIVLYDGMCLNSYLLEELKNILDDLNKI